jgi:hypothetical protein
MRSRRCRYTSATRSAPPVRSARLVAYDTTSTRVHWRSASVSPHSDTVLTTLHCASDAKIVTYFAVAVDDGLSLRKRHPLPSFRHSLTRLASPLLWKQDKENRQEKKRTTTTTTNNTTTIDTDNNTNNNSIISTNNNSNKNTNTIPIQIRVQILITILIKILAIILVIMLIILLVVLIILLIRLIIILILLLHVHILQK